MSYRYDDLLSLENIKLIQHNLKQELVSYKTWGRINKNNIELT